MEKKVETATMGLGFGVYSGMEKKMETTTMGLWFRVWDVGFRVSKEWERERKLL